MRSEPAGEVLVHVDGAGDSCLYDSGSAAYQKSQKQFQSKKKITALQTKTPTRRSMKVKEEEEENFPVR